MIKHFENQQVMSSTAVAIILGEECQSFANWPQGLLPEFLLREEECSVESKFNEPLSHIKDGKSSKKAQEALTAVYGLHPVIRTQWGMLLGRTSKCGVGNRMYHAVEIHTSACWALDRPEIVNRFGTGFEFSPFSDLAYELIKHDEQKYNDCVKDFPIKVAVADNYGLIEISCRFKKTSDRSEDKAAFAALMQFTGNLFQTGRMDEIVAQSCKEGVLKRAMILALWSEDLESELKELKKISGPKARLCNYDNIPSLSSPSVAAALMTIGVCAESWPTTSYPAEPVAIHQTRLKEKQSSEFPDAGLEEKFKVIKEEIVDWQVPRPVLRTRWGMIQLTRYVVEYLGTDRGMYRLRVFVDKAWRREECVQWSERAAVLLAVRTQDLLTKSAEYPIEISDCDEHATLDISCDFSLAGGPEAASKAEGACMQALVDYTFHIFASGLIDVVLEDAFSGKPIVVTDQLIPA